MLRNVFPQGPAGFSLPLSSGPAQRVASVKLVFRSGPSWLLGEDNFASFTKTVIMSQGEIHAR